jgi:hypothetical protein
MIPFGVPARAAAAEVVRAAAKAAGASPVHGEARPATRASPRAPPSG